MTRLPFRLGIGVRLSLLATVLCVLVSCQSRNNLPALGDHGVDLWSGDTIAFVPGRPVDSVLTDRGDYRLDAGRIRLKPIALPHRDRQCAITLDVSLRSNGDPWDKSGTLFAFADGAGRD